MSGLPFNGRYNFVALAGCGHCFAERVMSSTETKQCCLCATPFNSEDVIPVLPEDDVLNKRRKELGASRKKRKRQQAAAGEAETTSVVEEGKPEAGSVPKEVGPKDENFCSICMSTLDPKATLKGDRAVALDCAHTFHSKCIDKWLVELDKDTCPICKQVSTKRSPTIVTKVLQITHQPL